MTGLQTRFIASRDGKRLRVGVWDAGAAPRGVCVLLNGQTEFLEKYDEVADELVARGFTVASFDWRGQGGSERLLPDWLKVHVKDFADYDGDLAAFMDEVVRPLTDRPPVALAHSMGAHILLRALHAAPAKFAATVMTAPMMRAGTRGFPPWLVRFICRLQNLFGHGDDWVWGMDKRDPLGMAFEDNLVTSDRARFARNSALVAAHPDLRLAGPTWGWLQAAYRAMAATDGKKYAETITTPTLVFGAGRDRIVETSASRDFAARMPNARYVEFSDSEHEILMETDAIRARFWAEFNAFVGKYI